MAKTYLNELAYKTIRERILTCQYAPKSFIKEEQLVTDLNISRTPIRSALVCLEQEHLLQIISKKGIFITDITYEQVHEIYESRCLIEPYAIRNYGAHFPKQDLQAHLQQFQAPQSDLWTFFCQDDLFHRQIVDLCGNQLLSAYYRTIQGLNMRISVRSSSAYNRIDDSNQEHIAIISALLADDYGKAERLLIEHLNEARRTAFNALE